MDKYYVLKENIKNSNLSELDKKTLIDILSKGEVDINSFVLSLLRILKLSSTILKVFDIDIGN